QPVYPKTRSTRSPRHSPHHHCHHSSFFFNPPATTEIYTLSLHDALPISLTPGASSPNATSIPSERPIQFRCIVVTCWGHSIFEKSSSCSAYAVVFRNHCSKSR